MAVIPKGTTHDFAPNKTKFHVYRSGDEASPAVEISIEAVKAVFFVKSYEGNSQHKAAYSFDEAKGQGRKIKVVFIDGKEMSGLTMGYNPQKQGFFIAPSDPGGNNTRVYVMNSAVASVEWV